MLILLPRVGLFSTTDLKRQHFLKFCWVWGSRARASLPINLPNKWQF